MKKKILVVVLAIVMMFTVAGCGLKKPVTTDDNYVAPNSNAAHDKTKVKSKCTVLSCMTKLKAENTVEEIDKITGIKGELTTDSSYKVYTWTFSDKEKITATYYSSDKANIEATYIRDDIANRKVDFSKYAEIKSQVQSGMTYDEFKAKVGGVEGTLVYISSSSNKYAWANKKGEYLTGTFSNTTNKCTFFIGQVKQK